MVTGKLKLTMEEEMNASEARGEGRRGTVTMARFRLNGTMKDADKTPFIVSDSLGGLYVIVTYRGNDVEFSVKEMVNEAVDLIEKSEAEK